MGGIAVKGQSTGSHFFPRRGASVVGGVPAKGYGQVQTFTRRNSSSNEGSGAKIRTSPRTVKMPEISNPH